MLGKIIETGQDTVYIKLSEKSNFKLGEEVVVNKPKKIRTLKQNATYWLYLSWCICPYGGCLQSLGHFSAEALHNDIKEWIKATHEHDFKMDKRFTTTELTRKEFTQFWEFVNQELMVEILGVDTSPFWKDLDKFTVWQESNPGGMDEYLAERLSF